MLTFGRLLKRHDRKGFDCGNEALNDYLQRRASQEMKCGDAVCHVLTEDDGNEILGFFTLLPSAHAVPLRKGRKTSFPVRQSPARA